MNTSVESLTHKMQRAAVGKMVDVVLSHADKVLTAWSCLMKSKRPTPM